MCLDVHSNTLEHMQEHIKNQLRNVEENFHHIQRLLKHVIELRMVLQNNLRHVREKQQLMDGHHQDQQLPHVQQDHTLYVMLQRVEAAMYLSVR